MRTWTFITAFGDSAVLLPITLVIVIWLALFRITATLVWRWLFLLAAVGGLIAASKLAFMAWGIGIPSLDFTGVSGHSAMSAMLWPLLLALLGSGGKRYPRIIGAILGLLFAMAIALSRVVLNAHSWAEVLSGFVLGASAAVVFLSRLGSRWRIERPYWPPAVALLLVLSIAFGYRFPSERLLHGVAKHLNIDNAVHTRDDLGARHE
jgi:membrane-associated phospholipid phosphatase